MEECHKTMQLLFRTRSCRGLPSRTASMRRLTILPSTFASIPFRNERIKLLGTRAIDFSFSPPFSLGGKYLFVLVLKNSRHRANNTPGGHYLVPCCMMHVRTITRIYIYRGTKKDASGARAGSNTISRFFSGSHINLAFSYIESAMYNLSFFIFSRIRFSLSMFNRTSRNSILPTSLQRVFIFLSHCYHYYYYFFFGRLEIPSNLHNVEFNEDRP